MTPTPKSTLQTISDSMADVVEAVSPSIVTVDARRRIPASGIAVSDTHILTADHTVERQEDIYIVSHDGERVPAVFAGHDPASDLALLQVTLPQIIPASFSESDPRVGEMVFALGRPSSQGIQASLGIITAVSGPLRTAHGGILDSYLRTDATPYPGFSGGPMVNAAGQVLAVNTSGVLRGTSIGIPQAHIHNIVEMLKNHGRVPRGYLGIRSQPVDLPLSQHQLLERSQETGLLIVGIEEDSPASRAGLFVGDILVGLAGQQITDPQDLYTSLASLVVGAEALLDIVRGGQLQSISVIIGERKKTKN